MIFTAPTSPTKLLLGHRSRIPARWFWTNSHPLSYAPTGPNLEVGERLSGSTLPPSIQSHDCALPTMSRGAGKGFWSARGEHLPFSTRFLPSTSRYGSRFWLHRFLFHSTHQLPVNVLINSGLNCRTLRRGFRSRSLAPGRSLTRSVLLPPHKLTSMR